ncbi:MAG: Pycsar system effector family protein [Allorhizobium sp.]|uniref:Pycsar system effector family protein n=1 Tax=Allorhizobium sp. TaxID=633478 RepID=UPI004034CB9D
MDDLVKFKVETAERQLAAVQTFFPRLDGKVTTLFGIASAQFVVLLLNLTIEDLKHWYLAFLIGLYCLLYLAGLGWLYVCTHPHLAAGSRALTFFGHVAQLGENEFVVEYTSLTPEQLLNDLSRQIWRNSQIVAQKFKYLRNASTAILASSLPWLIIIIFKTIAAGALPELP